MRKIFKTIIAAVLVSGIYIYTDAKDKNISVDFTLEELAFSINILDTIELKGEEVSPFMEIKNKFITIYKKNSTEKNKSAEINLTLPAAKNFLFFMQRARLKGADASFFNNISNKMIEAIRKESKE